MSFLFRHLDGSSHIRLGDLTNVSIRREVEESNNFIIGQIIIPKLSKNIGDIFDVGAKSLLED
jgi:hypothetical protein